MGDDGAGRGAANDVVDEVDGNVGWLWRPGAIDGCADHRCAAVWDWDQCDEVGAGCGGCGSGDWLTKSWWRVAGTR